MANSRKVLIFMFAAILCASQGNSETVPIKVEVNFEVSAITNAWNKPTRTQVIQDSREAIAQELRTAYRHWDFRTDDTERDVTIILRINDPDPIDMVIEANLQLDVLIGDALRKSWSKKWLSSTEIQYSSYPIHSTMKKELALKFKKYFIEDRVIPLGEWLLNSVPVCKAGAWMNIPNGYKIVLSMPEGKYEYLSGSVFKIIEKPPQAPLPEILEAWGHREFAPYPVIDNSTSFNGITVKVVKRFDFHGVEKSLEPEVLNVKVLGPVYLKEEKPFEPLDVFFSKEDVQ